MNEEVTGEYEGREYRAEYTVIGDMLTVYLPDGTSRQTALMGLDPETAALTHLRSYARK